MANQLGRPRTLCEAYGAGGWDLRFEDMKRIGDWLYVLGVNTLDQHLSYVTLRGARKRDHPQSFSYHEPWWDAYHDLGELFRAALGRRCRGAAGQPTSWCSSRRRRRGCTNAAGTNPPELEGARHVLPALADRARKAQVEYDLGCEDIIARHGSVEGRRCVVGKRDYRIVVLPPGTENLNGATAELLDDS